MKRWPEGKYVMSNVMMSVNFLENATSTASAETDSLLFLAEPNQRKYNGSGIQSVHRYFFDAYASVFSTHFD